MSAYPKPMVGVAIILLRDDKVLMGKRRGSHGEGAWAFPGGSLEFGEGTFECARREGWEEIGIDLGPLEHGPHTNDFFVEAGKHYATLYVIARESAGEPRVMEPEKCFEWRWCSWNDLPSPLFLSVENLRRTGFDPAQDQ